MYDEGTLLLCMLCVVALVVGAGLCERASSVTVSVAGAFRWVDLRVVVESRNDDVSLLAQMALAMAVR